MCGFNMQAAFKSHDLMEECENEQRENKVD